MDNFGLKSFVYYQDKDFYYFWKPAGLASSRWKSVSFLDLMCDEKYNWDIRYIVDSQMEFFWKEKELGLLNRLDWPTTWLLYFAKNPKVYNQFRELQKEWKIDKFYVAEVYGKLFEDSVWQSVRRSIWTSISTLIVLAAMFFLWNSDVLQQFSFTVWMWIVFATLSSIFLWVPLAYLLMWRFSKEKWKF